MRCAFLKKWSGPVHLQGDVGRSGKIFGAPMLPYLSFPPYRDGRFSPTEVKQKNVSTACLSLWERWPSAARPERLSHNALSVTFGDSSPKGGSEGRWQIFLLKKLPLPPSDEGGSSPQGGTKGDTACRCKSAISASLNCPLQHVLSAFHEAIFDNTCRRADKGRTHT